MGGDYPIQSTFLWGSEARMDVQDRDRPGCDGLLLCGGLGRRAGGRDKGLLRVDGESAVARAATLLRPHCERLFVSANRHLDDYRREVPDARIVPDLRDGFPGPLAALEAAAAVVEAPLLLSLPCDLPLLDRQVPQLLLEALFAEPATQLVHASDGERPQYLCAALRRECLALAAGELDAGRHAVRDWLARLRRRALPLTPELQRGLRNFNDSADWAALAPPGTQGGPERR